MLSKREVDLRAVVMPTRGCTEVFRLVAAIEVAETAQALNVSEGFLLGLETASATPAALVEELYFGFKIAAKQRLFVICET
ncbi:hypothetical protein [Pseudomonas sp. TMW 2.1634]|uniref:hypothetical protein n=1 Tax=Pseudomonas sp. TMW 2.1634 TaxID=1886807 RepID=UPI000E70B63B|nr:hypothetical protein [Pseudomonas sp. TMW 2.1634]AOA08824.1 hypothetical protein BFC21_24780 [Pseudomonas sp. TMW 2.1634]